MISHIRCSCTFQNTKYLINRLKYQSACFCEQEQQIKDHNLFAFNLPIGQRYQ